MKRVVAALWLRIRSNASLFWRWFRYWRKRYMWLRLLILLAVFAQPIYETRRPLIRELVVIAIKGIESAKLGPRFETRAFQHQEKKRLQRALIAQFDTNGDGQLSLAEGRSLNKQTGLATEQVEGRALDVELDPLVAANHAAGLLSGTRTANRIRRQALAAALVERQREHEALWEEVEADLEIPMPSLRDLLEWHTWRERGSLFVGHLLYPAAALAPTLFRMPSLVWIALGLGALIAIATRRYAKGEELERRFAEEPSLAAAPCPVCGTPTHDYGALAQHRATRAWASGGIAFLTAIGVGAATGSFSEAWAFPAPAGILASATWYALAAGVVVGAIRYVVWPREVHACHQRRYLPLFGFVVSTVLVVALASYIALFGMHRLKWPRRTVLIIGSSGMMRRLTRMQPVVRTEPAAPAAVMSVPARAPGSRLARGGERRTDRAGRRERAAGERRPRGRAERAPQRR